MATVSDALQSSVALKSVVSSMNLTALTMERVNVTSNKLSLGQSFEIASQKIGLVNIGLDFMSSEIAKSADKQEDLNEKVKEGSKEAKILKDVFDKLGGFETIKKVVKISDEWVQSSARLELIVDDGGSVEELRNKIFSSAQSSRALYTDMVSSVTELGLTARDSFNNTDEIIKFTEMVQKMGTISGLSESDLSSTAEQINQVMSSGGLQGGDYESIIGNMPILGQAIADYMGIGINELENLASQGKITSSIIKSAMFNVSNEVDEKFKKMPTTWGQVWNGIVNNILIYTQPILELINSLANNWDTLRPIVLGVAAVLGAYLTILTLVNIWQGITAIGTAFLTAFRKKETKAIFAQTLAQNGLNAALLACPLTWIILLIVALIVVFAIFTEQIMGAIFWLGGLFKNVGLWIANCGIAAWEVIKNIGLWFVNLGLSIEAVIKNIGLWFANLGLGIWEALGAVAHNVGAAFINTWKEIQIKFLSFVETVLTGVKDISNKINSLLGIFGVEIDISGISKELDNIAEKKKELQNDKLIYKDIGEAWNKGFNTYKYESVSKAYNTNKLDWSKVSDGFNTFEDFQNGWSSDSYNKGAEVGKDIKGWMNSFSLLKDKDDKDYKQDAINPDDLLSAASDQEYDVNVKDEVNLADESLKYLLDEVTQKYINNINLQAPAPNVSVQIDVENGSDLDLDAIAEKTKQKLGVEIVEFAMSSTDIKH